MFKSTSSGCLVTSSPIQHPISNPPSLPGHPAKACVSRSFLSLLGVTISRAMLDGLVKCAMALQVSRLRHLYFLHLPIPMFVRFARALSLVLCREVSGGLWASRPTSECSAEKQGVRNGSFDQYQQARLPFRSCPILTTYLPGHTYQRKTKASSA